MDFQSQAFHVSHMEHDWQQEVNFRQGELQDGPEAASQRNKCSNSNSCVNE